MSPPPTRPRRPPMRGRPTRQPDRHRPGNPRWHCRVTHCRHGDTGLVGGYTQRKDQLRRAGPRPSGLTRGVRAAGWPSQQTRRRRRSGNAGGWSSGPTFNGRMWAGRQLRGFGSTAARGTASPIARAWLRRQVKREALRHAVRRDCSSTGSTLDGEAGRGSGSGPLRTAHSPAVACRGRGGEGFVGVSNRGRCPLLCTWPLCMQCAL